ncbi:MAG: hypothetical protein NT050_13575, partial [Verrucomicrobia bacterium]|nr:hypothetical protein [Verrucomicrobiota bacterium]
MGGTQHHRLESGRPTVWLRAELIRRMMVGGYRPETDGSNASDLLRWLWKYGGLRLRLKILRSLARVLERRRRKRPVLRAPETPPPDSSLTAWLKAHGHVLADMPKPPRRRPDPGEIAGRWLRRSIHGRLHRKPPLPAPVVDPVVEAWKTRHESGAPRMVRPSGPLLTPRTRRRKNPRRAFRDELESELSELPQRPEVPQRLLRGESFPETAPTGWMPPGGPARWRRASARQSGPVRILLFGLRALRRTLRMALRLRKVPASVEAPQTPRTLEDADLESSLQKVLERLFDGRFQDVRHSRDLLRGVRQLLEADTDRPLEKDLALKDDQIQMLEQKIRRLAALLKENERQRELMRTTGGVKLQFVSGVGAVDPGVKSG